MSDRATAHSSVPTPFVSSEMRVEPQWIDYNGHLNMAYYNVLFDRAIDELLQSLGMGTDYVVQQRRSMFAAEVHLRYLRELREGNPVRVSVQLIDCDAKRVHTFAQLMHAKEKWLSATSENMSLHVDLDAKKTAPFSPDVAARLAAMKAAHAKLPLPEGAGRRIAMPAKA